MPNLSHTPTSAVALLMTEADRRAEAILGLLEHVAALARDEQEMAMAKHIELALNHCRKNYVEQQSRRLMDRISGTKQ